MAREPMPDIIVLLPGVLGSVLKRNGRTVWGFSGTQLARSMLTRGRRMRRDLWVAVDDPDTDDLGDGITADALMPDLHLLPGLWKIDGYTAIRRGLEAVFELTEGENFFPFPYDWRRDNRVSARRLARDSHRWLERRRAQVNPDAKLILVGHSMGGLVARYFCEVLEGWKDTRALLTFGTPYRGSLNALETLANGMRMGPMGLMDLSDLARQLQSLYQLLPIYPVYDPGDGTLLRVGETAGIPNVDPARARSALEDFHREIQRAQAVNRNDPAYEAKGRWVHPIVGIGQTTSQSARLDGTRVQVRTEREGRDLSGDGTVPRVSAIPPEESQGSSAMYSGTKHAAIQNAEPVLRHLTGVIESLYFDLGDFMRPHTPPGKIALEVDDLVWYGEPLTLRAHAEQEVEALRAEVRSDDPGVEPRSVDLHPGADGWLEGRFDAPAPGHYTLQVTGPSGTEPVADAVAVLDLTVEEALAEAEADDEGGP